MPPVARSSGGILEDHQIGPWASRAEHRRQQPSRPRRRLGDVGRVLQLRRQRLDGVADRPHQRGLVDRGQLRAGVVDRVIGRLQQR